MGNRIIQGCMRIANKTEEEVYQMILTDLSLGINMFDHADIYGRGKCEEIFGNVLNKHKELRGKIIIQTKCGIKVADGKKTFESSKDYILNCVNSSLKRLKTDYLDYLLIHRPDVMMEPKGIDEALDILFKEGKIRHFGVSNFNRYQIEYLQKRIHHKIEVNQLQYSICHTNLIDGEFYTNTKTNERLYSESDLFYYCIENNIRIQAWSPFQYGFFAGSFLDNYEKYPDLNNKLDELAEKYNVQKNAIAVSFIFKTNSIFDVVIGSTSPEHIKDISKANMVNLTRQEFYDIYASSGHVLP